MRWTTLGPATLIGCGCNDALHIDSFEWNVDIAAGGVRLQHRLGAAELEPIILSASRATVCAEVCACGNSDVLITLPL